jgi:hypothetical protein
VPPRTFTPEEANALLPQVRELAQALVERRVEQLAAQARRGELAAQIGRNGGGLDPSALAAASEAIVVAEARLRESLAALLDLGVQVKDLDAGLVDFPSIRDGEEVLLCWQLGEERVAWWHRPEDGFAGRRPL